MWKALWKKWTIDKPAALGDWLWDVFVVQLAALLDRLTLRQIIAFIPVVPVLLIVTGLPAVSKAKLSGALMVEPLVVHVEWSSSAMKASLYAVPTHSGNSSE